MYFYITEFKPKNLHEITASISQQKSDNTFEIRRTNCIKIDYQIWNTKISVNQCYRPRFPKNLFNQYGHRGLSEFGKNFFNFIFLADCEMIKGNLSFCTVAIR